MSPPHPSRPNLPVPGPEYQPSNAELLRYMQHGFNEIRVEQEDQCKRLGKIENAMLGTMDPPRQGLVDQVRDLKSKARGASKLVWGALTAAAGAAGIAAWNFFIGGHQPPTGHQ